MSANIFAANSKEQATEPENNKLLRCRECHVTVHASCYGITILPKDIRNWACDRCKAGRNDVVRVEKSFVFFSFFSLYPVKYTFHLISLCHNKLDVLFVPDVWRSFETYQR